MSKKQILSNFEFKQRFGKINWNQIIQLDLDTILANGDIESLQSVLENLTYSTLDRDDIERIGDSNVLKVFKLSQLAIEYLISIHSQLDASGKEFSKKQAKYYEENQMLKENLIGLEKEVSSLKAEYLGKKKAVQTYELLLKQPGTASIMNKVVTRANAITCEFCKKAFISHEFLEEHKKRRHLNDVSRESGPSFDISPFLEVFKTFTEQRIQAVTEAHKREIESLKELMKIQLEIQKDHEATSFQKLLLMQSHSNNMHEDMYNKLLMETQYEKEKITRMISEDIKRIEERDKILMSLKEAQENLKQEVAEKEINLNDLISHENSMSNEIEVISQPYPDSPEKFDEGRVSTPIPSQLIQKVSQKVLFENSAPEQPKQVVIPINIEESYDYEIPVLSEIKSSSDVLIGKKPIESNAGEILTDSDVEHLDVTDRSNAGEIITDSDVSEEGEDFEVIMKKKIEVKHTPVMIDREREEIDIEIITVNSEKIEPAFSKNIEKNKDEMIEQISKSNVPDAGSSKIIKKNSQKEEVSIEQAAKLIGIDLVSQKNYTFIAEMYLKSELPHPWTLVRQENETFYVNSETGEVCDPGSKLKIYSNYFSQLKANHSAIYNNILMLHQENFLIKRKNHDKPISASFNHDLEKFETHKKKIFNEIISGSGQEEAKKEKISKRDIKKQRKLLETHVMNLIENKIAVDKNKEFIDNYKDMGGKKERVSDLNKSNKEINEHEKNPWSYNQGINVIQNRNILKDNVKVTSGQYFQEGNLLGEHYFERNTGLPSDENFSERVIFM